MGFEKVEHKTSKYEIQTNKQTSKPAGVNTTFEKVEHKTKKQKLTKNIGKKTQNKQTKKQTNTNKQNQLGSTHPVRRLNTKQTNMKYKTNKQTNKQTDKQISRGQHRL